MEYLLQRCSEKMWDMIPHTEANVIENFQLQSKHNTPIIVKYVFLCNFSIDIFGIV